MQPSFLSGHRNRLRERFNQSPDSLADYELLELLLGYAISRRDTKPLAKGLLHHFKSLRGVVHAPREQLEHCSGIGPYSTTLLKLLRQINCRILQQQSQHQHIMHNRAAVERYLQFEIGQRQMEYVALLFLNTAHAVLRSTIIAKGTVNQCTVYPRNVFKEALREGAAAVILAHNHPGGTTRVSQADWHLTKRIYHAGQLLDLPLLDHIIVTDTRSISLRELPEWPATSLTG
jgi:DNA repair protein RadC